MHQRGDKLQQRKSKRGKGKRRHLPVREGSRASADPAPVEENKPVPRVDLQAEWPKWAAGGLVLFSAFIWAYWPTLSRLVRAWEDEPDYSHGYLVAPLALFFLWARREGFPGIRKHPAWAGLVLIAAAVALRFVGALAYVDAVDGWSILVALSGVAWLLGGWQLFWWSAPAIAFLFFMIPLPYRVERWMRLPLQEVATDISSWTLQTLGQPAVAEGNTILLGSHQLEVEEACSGLRIFVSIAALAFAYLVLVRRAWWEKALLIASILPIALVANATRIVATGMLYQYVSGEAAHKFSHDVSGWAMIPFAAALFGLVLWYLSQLFRTVTPATIKAALGEAAKQQ